MLTRCLSLFAASLVATAVAAGPAQSRTDVPAPNVPAGACTDQTPPTSTYTSKAAKKAKTSRTHKLSGTASDVGCGLDRVEVSVARKTGKKCQYMTNALRLSGRRTSCGKPAHWRLAKGTTKWSLQLLPKKTARGKYVIRTRATDFAGNVQKVKSHSLNVR
jgi:hypothetical protein